MNEELRGIVSELCDGRRSDDAVAVLERHWITSVAALRECDESTFAHMTELPALLRTRLSRRAKQKEEARQEKEEEVAKDEEEEKGANKEAEELSEEDAEQKRIVDMIAGWVAEGKVQNHLCRIWINSVSDLSTAESSVMIDIGVCLWYHDAAHVGAEEGEPDYDKVFKPILEFGGALDVEPLIEVDKGASFYIRDEYRKHGIISWYQRYRGRVRVNLEMRQFPFDSQTLSILVGATLWGADAVTLVEGTLPVAIESFTDPALSTLHEWHRTGPISLSQRMIWNLEDKRDISYIEIKIPLQRKAGFFMHTCFYPVYLLQLLACAQFFLGDATADRINLCLTVFLALVAFNYYVAESLPKISHATWISTFFLINYLCITVAAAQGILLAFIPGHDYLDTIMFAVNVAFHTGMLLLFKRKGALHGKELAYHQDHKTKHKQD